MIPLATDNAHQDAELCQGKKPHQGDFSKNRALCIGGIRAKWLATHQDTKCWWSEIMSGSALDANGNTLSKTTASGTTQYAWDFENRLSSVTLPGSGGTVSFRYDPSGRRIQKAFTQGSTTTTTNYVYNGPNVIEEVDASGNLLAHYAQGLGMDEPLAELRSSTNAFYEADGLGSITSLSTSTGTISNSYVYDAFGNATALSGSFVNPYRYTGRDYDPETGLQYSRARYYDPTVGRFISEDPIRFEGGIDFYSYVTGNPVNLIDPSGLQSCCNKPCFVDVRCWPIETYHLGAVGFKHCFVTVRDKNCKLHDVSGGPQNGRLFEWDTPPVPHPNALTYSHTEVPCPQVDCITAMAPVITGLNLPYKSMTQNSNSGVATILFACGLPNLSRSLPAGAWGQSTPLLPFAGPSSGRSPGKPSGGGGGYAF
jgi:RHS repeat-associated protein